MDRPPLTIGTAGHIDHGKTALVAALTGRQTDRLPQERARGISIELGYAPLLLGNGRALSVIDVPGHERFVRTMVAGASGIDLFLLCVAADDGVMPQTLEHLAVLRQLGIEHGVAVVTKADLGEPELVAEEVAELLPGTPIVRVCALKGEGIRELLTSLEVVTEDLPGRAGSDGPIRLHIDRSFTLRGIGTVVTGTLWSGIVTAGESVRLMPRGLVARVRSVQVHERPVASAVAGQRVAVNLGGVGWREVGRGDVLVDANSALEPSYLLDVAARLEPGSRPLKRGARIHVHHGTREAPARVVPLMEGELSSGYAQLRLEAPLVADAGDHLILRQLAPPDTIGGAVVIDPRPRKHGPASDIREQLAAIERGENPPESPQAPPPLRPPSMQSPLDDAALELLALLRSDGSKPRSDAELARAAKLPEGDANERLGRLEQAGQAIRVGRSLHFHPVALAAVEARVIDLCERDGMVSIASLRDELDTSRKYAQAMLEYFDRSRVTRRDGDAHVLRRRGS